MTIIQLQKLLNVYESKVFYKGKNYSQFTIDFIQDFNSDANNDDLHEREGLGSVRDLIGSKSYQLCCVIEIIKEGPDKELLSELQKDLELLLS